MDFEFLDQQLGDIANGRCLSPDLTVDVVKQIQMTVYWVQNAAEEKDLTVLPNLEEGGDECLLGFWLEEGFVLYYELKEGCITFTEGPVQVRRYE